MLPDLKKFVGKRTDVDAEISQCKARIHERPGDAPQLYLKIGQLYASVEEKEAALEVLSEAAQLAAKANNPEVALAANKLIVQLDPENKDALANLAILRFQGGANGFGEDYQKILQGLSNAPQAKDSVTTLQDSESASQLAAKLARAGRPKTERKRVDKAFENDRKALHDLIEGGGADAEAIPLESLKFESDRKALISLIEDSDLPGERPLLAKQGKEPFSALQPSSPMANSEHEPVSIIPPADDIAEILFDLTASQPPVVKLEDEDRGGKPSETVIAQPQPPSAQADRLPGLLRRLPLFSQIPETAVHEFFQALSLDVVLTRPFPKEISDQALALTVQIVLPSTPEQAPAPLTLSLGFNPLNALLPSSPAPAILELTGTILVAGLENHLGFLKELGIAGKQRCFLPTISQSLILGQLPEDIRAALATQCIIVKAAPDATIIAEGASDDNLYLIHSGEVEMSATLAEREEVQVIQMEQPHIRLAKLRAGDIFGEDGFLTKEPHTNTVRALTEVYLLKFPAAMLTTLLKTSPQFEALLQQYHQQRAAATLKFLQAALLGTQS